MAPYNIYYLNMQNTNEPKQYLTYHKPLVFHLIFSDIDIAKINETNVITVSA